MIYGVPTVEIQGSRDEVAAEVKATVQRWKLYQKSTRWQNLMAACPGIGLIFSVGEMITHFQSLWMEGALASLGILVALGIYGDRISLLNNDRNKLAALEGLFAASSRSWSSKAVTKLVWKRQEPDYESASGHTEFDQDWARLESQSSAGFDWLAELHRTGYTNATGSEDNIVVLERSTIDRLVLSIEVPRTIPVWWKDCFGLSPFPVDYVLRAGRVYVATDSKPIVYRHIDLTTLVVNRELFTPEQVAAFIEWFLVGAEQVIESCPVHRL
jgi:hypothetical protein